MNLLVQSLVTILCSVLASSGMWAFLSSKVHKKDAKTKMLLGLGHDRIVNLCLEYIDRTWLTADEYDNLYKYLYLPYKELGGNGTCERLISIVQGLEIRNSHEYEEH